MWRTVERMFIVKRSTEMWKVKSLETFPVGIGDLF